MTQTSREIVTRTLKFESPERLPRDIWRLPWADRNIPQALAEIDRRWPGDLSRPGNVYGKSNCHKGNPYIEGTYVDEWGCVFENIQYGVHGEVKNPILQDPAGWKSIVKPPYEILPGNAAAAKDSVSRDCGRSDKFMLGGCCARPWERYQFIRGTEDAMMDMMEPDANIKSILKIIHEFFLKEYEFWCSTDVDAVTFMDDWGSQNQLLIPPSVWRDIYKPFYKEYCDMAHAHGKFIFMHSDGYISEILEDLMEIGVDALNSQLFCMDIPDHALRGKGKITFWGEIDRQHVLPSKNPDDGRKAVRKLARYLFDRKGGIIVQFEASPGCNPETAIAVMEEWDSVQREAGMNP